MSGEDDAADEQSAAFDLVTAPRCPMVMEPPCFEWIDWGSFALTTVVALAIYLWTLAPEVDLGDSGVYATGAMYPGVPCPPGHPIWIGYAWMFTVLLPVSNVAWRCGVATAVSAAFACGMVALMASHSAGMVLKGLKGFERSDPEAQRPLRVMSGFVAGMGFGFSNPFWNSALTADPWPLSTLLLAIVLAFIMCWCHAPAQTRWLYAAVFCYGLTLTNSQEFVATALGLEFLILFVNAGLARDVFAAMAFVLAGCLLVRKYFPDEFLWTRLIHLDELRREYWGVVVITGMTSLIITVRTHEFLTHWKTVLAGGFFFALGLSPYLLVPILSMTNPPINWGYPRTDDGFFHVLSRGQYESIRPTDSLGDFIQQAAMYIKMSARDFGTIYLVLAVVPFCFWRRMDGGQRRWLFGWLCFYVISSACMLILLNMPADRISVGLYGIFFSPLYLVLADLSACGLALVGLLCNLRSKKPIAHG